MNFTKLIEALEIFKKYTPHDDDPDVDYFPLDVDYMAFTVNLDNVVMEPADIKRLEELDWSVRKHPAWRSQARTVTDEEVGRYEINYDFRDVFRAKKKAQEEASKTSENNS